MKNLYIISITLLLPCLLQAQITFERTYSNINPYEQSAKEIVATGDGGYLMAGMTRTAIVNDSDLLIIKTNNIGDVQWTKQYGGPLPEYPNGILPLEDGGFFIIGYTKSYGGGNNDCWLIKINSSGDMAWSKTYGGSGDDEGKEIIKAADGNYVFVGRTNYSSGGSNFDGFLKKVDGSGNEIWTKYYGGGAYENMRSVRLCSDGGFIAIGQTLSFGAGGSDIYLVRTNSNGDATWTKTYGGPLEDDGNWVLANSDGSFTLTAETTSYGAGDFDVQAMKVDASGGEIWNKFYGGDKKDVSKTIRYTNDGGYIIGAISRSFGWINPQMWLVKINGNGDMVWDRNYGSWYHDHCHSVIPTPDGGYASVGHQVDVNEFSRFFLVKTNSEGALVGVDEIASAKSFNIFPNPSNGIFNIQSASAIKSVHISDALGNSIKTIPGESNNLKFDIADKPKGAYMITVQTAKSAVTKKIVLR
jgi:hypothetical protein